jgi:hypothetical protein
MADNALRGERMDLITSQYTHAGRHFSSSPASRKAFQYDSLSRGKDGWMI